MKRIDPEQIMAPLKKFQRRTVEHVFRRMYLDEDLTRRFLVADEVGLGKTMIARGVIAKVIDHLYDTTKRIDIIYICSNGNIARQNINRLNVLENNEIALPGRITLLPTKLKELNQNKVNFISLTPATSFDLKSNLGRSEERVLLYYLLQSSWTLAIDPVLEIFRGDTSADNFRRQVEEFDVRTIDPLLHNQFLTALAPETGHLRKRLLQLIVEVDRTSPQTASEVLNSGCRALIGELRSILARACINALEPDLIILDEFQRFKELMEPGAESGTLARELFDYENKLMKTRVLLLSATPYKMYTLSREVDNNHYADFHKTIRFLLNSNDERLDHILHNLEQYRLGLLATSDRDGQFADAKQCLELELRRIMSRTERLAVTPDRNGMLSEVPPSNHTLRTSDLNAFLAYQRIATFIGAQDVMEYWKSAPYLLSFMQDYRFKQGFRTSVNTDLKKNLSAIITASHSILFGRAKYEAYEESDPDNARMRSLLAMTVDRGLWKLLWLPPSLPYYQLEEPFQAVATQSLTKQLVFSNWQVVPRVIASLISYEAERSIHSDKRGTNANTPDARGQFSPPLRFSVRDGAPTSMSLMTLVYPSIRLAELGDSLYYFCASIQEGEPIPSAKELLNKVENQIIEYEIPALQGKYMADRGGPPDESWYWAAPLLMDYRWYQSETREWVGQQNLATEWGRDTEPIADSDNASSHSAWQSHVARMKQLLRGHERLGPMPADLSVVLAVMAISSPAIVTLRSLTRIVDNKQALRSEGIRLAAGRVAQAFLSLFNSPEAASLLKSNVVATPFESSNNEPYWQRVLGYCQAGCLQAVLDEYIHILNEALGFRKQSELDTASQIADAIQNAIRLRTANLRVDDIQGCGDSSDDVIAIEPFQVRNHIAMRFGTERSEDDKTEIRAERVRESFNSPFWPFVLATTSIGQEGLDFHPYCHSVVHWNLPSNPVDLEQREGRVHRYKGHAIRKNVARAHAKDVAADQAHRDPWQAMFDAAAQTSESELSPYWIYENKDGTGVRIASIVPAFALSREEALHSELRQSLAAYRFALGQPRQEDLLEFLQKQTDGNGNSTISDEMRINLEPPNEVWSGKTESTPKPL